MTKAGLGLNDMWQFHLKPATINITVDSTGLELAIMTYPLLRYNVVPVFHRFA